MTPPLSGKFLYQSFRDDPIAVSNGKVVGTPALAVPWAPVGTLEIVTDAVLGDVSGKLTFRPGVALDVSGKITPAVAPLPARLELQGEGLGAVYRIVGWLIPYDQHVVGTVLCLTGDLARQPVGTIGPFALSPAK